MTSLTAGTRTRWRPTTGLGRLEAWDVTSPSCCRAARPVPTPRLLLVPSLAVEETGAQVKVVPYPELRPRGLERAEALEFDAFVSERVVEILAETSPSKVTFIASWRHYLPVDDGRYAVSS